MSVVSTVTTIIIVVGSLSSKLGMADFHQFFIKVTIAVVGHNALEEVRGGYTGSASRREELACGRAIENVP